jgi:hypothetical protein
MANNHVHEQVRARLGNSVVITVGSDSTSFRGKLIGIRPAGTDNSDAGIALTGNDDVEFIVRVGRQKS